MDKLYQRINYENSPSKKTPLSEANLNKMDKALDDLDNRIIEQDAAFAKSIEEEDKKIEEVNGKVSEIAGKATTLTQSKADAIVCTASGTIITATDSADAGFEQFRTFGKSVQDKTSGNQLAESYEAGTGVAQYTSVLFVKAELKPSTTYTISFEGTVGNWLYLNEQITAYKQFQVVSGRTVVTFTTVENMDSSNASKYDANKGWIICKNNNAQSEPNVFDNLMLNLGSTALPWEPYTNGPSPNPEYPQPIVSAGQKLENGIVSDVGISKRLTRKNLLPYPFKSQTNTQNGITFTNNNDGSVTANGTATADCYFRFVDSLVLDNECILSDAGTTKANTIFVYAYNQDTKTYYYTYSNQTPTLPAGKYDVNIKINSGATVSNAVFKPMIRLASIEDDTYEPYTEQTLTLDRVLNGIPLGQTIPDAIKSSPAHMAGVYWDDETQQYYIGDTEDGVNGVLVQRVKRGLLPKDNWAVEHSGEGKDFVEINRNISSVGLVQGTAIPLLCTICTETELSRIVYAYNHFYFKLQKSDTITSADDALEFVANNDIEYFGILATPIETPLTDEEIAAYKALHSNKPTTVITNDAGCYMEVEYVADPKNHIEQNYVPVSKYTALEERVSALEQLHV